MFEPALAVGLRNGVGHHSAHYDVVSDEIIYVKADDANLTEIRLPYTEFVDKVFAAYCAFELATVFFQWFFVAGGGRLRKDDLKRSSFCRASIALHRGRRDNPRGGVGELDF